MAVRPSRNSIYSGPPHYLRRLPVFQHLSGKLEFIPFRQDGPYAVHSDGSVGSRTRTQLGEEQNEHYVSGRSAEYRAARNRLSELRRATVHPTGRSRAMSLAAPHLAQETTR